MKNKILMVLSMILSILLMSACSNEKPVEMPTETPEEETEPEFIIPEIVGQSEDVDGFVPIGWEIFDKASDDFNGDSLLDVVGVIECIDKNARYPYPRVLFIAFKTDGGYELSTQVNYLIRNSDKGGIYEYPYIPIVAENGVFTT